MPTYTYSGPRRTAVRSGRCPVCGKRGTRRTTIEHTVNPLNRNRDGSVKTWGEVRADVAAEAETWESKPFTHEKCERDDA